MKTLSLLLASVLPCLTTTLHAQEPKPAPAPKTDKPAPAKSDYDYVKDAHLFAIGGIGVVGRPSGEEQSFRKVLAGPDAVAKCQTLTKDGTPEGKLYGLLGLKLLDAKAYQAAAAAFEKDDAKVQSAGGCVMFKTTVSAIAKEIAQGKMK